MTNISKIKHREFKFNFHNTDFFAQSWDVQDPKAIILLVHGMGEHSGRYGSHFASAFNKNNISVVAFDQFGHGKTSGKRGHTPGYEYNLQSISYLLSETKKHYGANTAVFLYGHSMGGNLVANFVLRKEDEIKGAIISSPMLRLAFTPPAWKLKIGGFLRNIYPKFTENTGLEVSAVSRDKSEVEKYIKDPLNHDKITINYSLPFFEAGEWALKNAHLLSENVFIFHGSGDRITDFKASKEYASKAKEFTTLKLYEGGFHELHNDICKQELFEDINQWINETL